MFIRGQTWQSILLCSLSQTHHLSPVAGKTHGNFLNIEYCCVFSLSLHSIFTATWQYHQLFPLVWSPAHTCLHWAQSPTLRIFISTTLSPQTLSPNLVTQSHAPVLTKTHVRNTHTFQRKIAQGVELLFLWKLFRICEHKWNTISYQSHACPRTMGEWKLILEQINGIDILRKTISQIFKNGTNS